MAAQMGCLQTGPAPGLQTHMAAARKRNLPKSPTAAKTGSGHNPFAKGEIALAPPTSSYLLLRDQKSRWECKTQREVQQVSCPQLPGFENPFDLRGLNYLHFGRGWLGTRRTFSSIHGKKRIVWWKDIGARKERRFGTVGPLIYYFPFSQPVLSHSLQWDFPKSPVPGSCPGSQRTSRLPRRPSFSAPGFPCSF